MRKLWVGAAIAGMMSGSAFADTLEHVIAKGIVLELDGGIEIPVTYAEDGTYIADVFGMEIAGVWRIEGKSLCTKAETDPEESCSEYPEGKQPGDSFDLSSPQGTAIIHINE